MKKNAMNVVVYIRAADAIFLKEKLPDVPSWVRQVVQANIEAMKERHERDERA